MLPEPIWLQFEKSAFTRTFFNQKTIRDAVISRFSRLFLAVATASTVFVSGCASIVSDSRYPVAITSNPSGANFEIKNRAGAVVHSGVTPGTVTLSAKAGYFKGETYTIVFHKDGYADQTITVDSSVDGWYWGNILLGGLIGMLIVDPATGAMYKLPNQADGLLTAKSADASSTPELKIVSLEQIPHYQRGSLQRIN